MAGDGYQLTVVSSTTIGALFLISLLRFYVRGWRIRSLGWDDYTMAVCVMVDIVGAAFNIKSVEAGFGRHADELTYPQIVQTRKWNELSQLFNIVGVWLVKVSICFFLLRVIRGTRKNFTIFLWCLLAANTVVNVGLFISWFCQAIPIDALWDVEKPATHMSLGGVMAISYLSAAFNLLTDVICALLPIFFFRNLKMSRRKKGILILLSTLGILTCVASILKLVWLHQIFTSQDISHSPLKDSICAQVEQNVGAFLANLPPIKPILIDTYTAIQSFTSTRSGAGGSIARKFSSMFGSSSSSAAHHTYGSYSSSAHTGQGTNYNQSHSTSMDDGLDEEKLAAWDAVHGSGNGET